MQAHAFKGAAVHEGEYEMDFIPGNIGYLLKSAFGSVASVAKSSPNEEAIDHTFSEAEAKPSLTIEQAIGDITRRFAGCICHTLTFACAKGEVLTLTAGIRAKANASASKISPSYETVRPLNFADNTAFSIGGQALTQVQNFELVYTNNHAMTHAIGSSNDPAFNYAKGSQVTGSLELYLDSTTAAEYADYLSKADQALVITFAGDTITGTVNKYGLSITVPKVNYTTASFPVNDDYNLLTVEFEGVYDTTTSKLIEAILTNTITAYT